MLELLKKFKINTIFTVIILLMFGYFLFLLNDISKKMEVGRYQFRQDNFMILDTKTGKVYVNRNGNLEEKK